MDRDQFPYPGVLSNGQKLRSMAITAIDAVQIDCSNNDDNKSARAAELIAFFNFCADITAQFVRPDPLAEKPAKEKK